MRSSPLTAGRRIIRRGSTTSVPSQRRRSRSVRWCIGSTHERPWAPNASGFGTAWSSFMQATGGTRHARRAKFPSSFLSPMSQPAPRAQAAQLHSAGHAEDAGTPIISQMGLLKEGKGHDQRSTRHVLYARRRGAASISSRPAGPAVYGYGWWVADLPGIRGGDRVPPVGPAVSGVLLLLR